MLRAGQRVYQIASPHEQSAVAAQLRPSAHQIGRVWVQHAVEVEKERTSDTTMSFWFDTANSAPDLVIKRMSELFPSLVFELNYEVEGYGYRHSLTYEAGEICDAREWEIEEEEEE